MIWQLTLLLTSLACCQLNASSLQLYLITLHSLQVVAAVLLQCLLLCQVHLTFCLQCFSGRLLVLGHGAGGKHSDAIGCDRMALT